MVMPLTMASPFVGVPMDLGARIDDDTGQELGPERPSVGETPVRHSIAQESLRQRVFQDRTDPLALPVYLMRYTGSHQRVCSVYLIILVGPYVGNATQRSSALTVAEKNGVRCYSQFCSCAQYIAKCVCGVS